MELKKFFYYSIDYDDLFGNKSIGLLFGVFGLLATFYKKLIFSVSVLFHNFTIASYANP